MWYIFPRPSSGVPQCPLCQGTPGLTPPPHSALHRFPHSYPRSSYSPSPFSLFVLFVPFLLYFSIPILWTTFLLSMYRRCARPPCTTTTSHRCPVAVLTPACIPPTQRPSSGSPAET